MTERIYFDNSATTPLDPRVAHAMQPYLFSIYGNASSLYTEGRYARQAMETAREQVANLLGAEPNEIIFTASGTEADNMALRGVLEAFGERENHIITSAIEHPAILETCRYLETRGVQVTYLPVNSEGSVEPVELLRALRPTTRLVSIMTANNVVGTIQPIQTLANITRRHGALFHTDAVQAVGKVPLDLKTTPIDLLSLSAHKLHGPKGIGVLYVRRGTPLKPLIHGGGQERGLRSATENVAGIVGLGAAADIARRELPNESAHLSALRDQIIQRVSATNSNAYLIGHREHRLPGHICLGFRGREDQMMQLMLALDEFGIAVSTGSACSAQHGSEPSYILQAMGFDSLRARGSLRVTLGRFNTQAQVDYFLDTLPKALVKIHPLLSRLPQPVVA